MKNRIISALLLMIISVTLTRGQNNRTGIDVKAGFNSPAFNFNDFYEGGAGVSFGGLYPFYDNLQFTLNVGYSTWSFDNTAFNLKNSNENYSDFNLDAPLTIIPLTAGLKYYATNSKVKPYFSAEFGFYYYTQKASGTYIWTEKPGTSGKTYTLTELKDSGFRTMINLGAGVVMPLSKDWDFDIQIKMNGLFNAQTVSGSYNDNSFDNESSTIYYISIAGGINYYFKTN